MISSSLSTNTNTNNIKFQTTWKPFMLIPLQVWENGTFTNEERNEGVNKMDWYCEKFGGKERVMPMIARLSKVFDQCGLPKYSLEGNTGPTMDAHRLAHYMKQDHSQEAQDLFMSFIMLDYFCNSKAPCDKDVLLAACEKTFSKEANNKAMIEEAKKVLFDQTKYRQEVLNDIRAIQSRVSGVPHFIITNESTKRKVEFSGAQPMETFLDAFEELT
jgi:predicted DsbA family dithiol-disulfide isomerase